MILCEFYFYFCVVRKTILQSNQKAFFEYVLFVFVYYNMVMHAHIYLEKDSFI